LESRSVIADDLARQVLMYGKRYSAQEICAKIDSLTKSDIYNIVRKLLRSRPTLVVYGKGVPELPDVEYLQEFFTNRLHELS